MLSDILNGHGWRNVLWFMTESIGTHRYFDTWKISPDYFRLSVEQSRCLLDLCYTLSSSDILYSDTSEVKFSNDQQTTSLQINISFKTEHTLRAVVRLYNIINCLVFFLYINNVVFHSPGFETHSELVALLHINVNTVLQIKLCFEKNMSQKN